MWDMLQLRFDVRFDSPMMEYKGDCASGESVYWLNLEKIPPQFVRNSTTRSYWTEDETGVLGWVQNTETRIAWDRIESSFSGVAVHLEQKTKVLKGRVVMYPHMIVKFSPVKLLQGYNTWGWVTLEQAYLNICWLLMEWLGHDVFHQHFQPELADVARLDATFSQYVADQTQKPLVFRMYRSAQYRQYRLKGDYGSTLKFGGLSGNNRESIIYDKEEELLHDLKQEKNPELKQLKEELLTRHGPRIAKSIRLEGRINARGLKYLGLPTKIVDLIKLEKTLGHPESVIMPLRPGQFPVEPEKNLCMFIWSFTFGEIMTALMGQELAVMSDEKVEKKLIDFYGYWSDDGKHKLTTARRLYRFYLALRAEGYDNERSRYDRSYRRNIGQLVKAGISRAMLQSIKPGEKVSVVQFPCIVSMDMRNQVPAGELPIRNLWEQVA